MNRKNLFNAILCDFSFGQIYTRIMDQHINWRLDIQEFLSRLMYVRQTAQVGDDVLTGDTKFTFNIQYLTLLRLER